MASCHHRHLRGIMKATRLRVTCGGWRGGIAHRAAARASAAAIDALKGEGISSRAHLAAGETAGLGSARRREQATRLHGVCHTASSAAA